MSLPRLAAITLYNNKTIKILCQSDDVTHRLQRHLDR